MIKIFQHNFKQCENLKYNAKYKYFILNNIIFPYVARMEIKLHILCYFSFMDFFFRDNFSENKLLAPFCILRMNTYERIRGEEA